MQDAKFHKVLVSVNALIPLAIIAFDAYRGSGSEAED